MLIETLVVGMIQANCFIVADEGTKKALIIDPGGDAPVIVRRIKELGLDVVAVVATHGHFDHVEALAGVKAKIPAPIMVHPDDIPLIRGMRTQGALFGISVTDAPPPDQLLKDGDEIPFGALTAKVIHTPGHSPGSVSILAGGHVFVGDLLFNGSIGRTDLMGGSYETLIQSVKQRIFTLAPETVVHPGHGPDTTVGFEKRTNPFFR